MATLRNKIRRIEPAHTGELPAIVAGKLNTFAVHLDYDAANMDYIITTVEPWDAYKHIMSENGRIYQVAEKDELGAFNKMRNFLDALLTEDETDDRD